MVISVCSYQYHQEILKNGKQKKKMKWKRKTKSFFLTKIKGETEERKSYFKSLIFKIIRCMSSSI